MRQTFSGLPKWSWGAYTLGAALVEHLARKLERIGLHRVQVRDQDRRGETSQLADVERCEYGCGRLARAFERDPQARDFVGAHARERAESRQVLAFREAFRPFSSKVR